MRKNWNKYHLKNKRFSNQQKIERANNEKNSFLFLVASTIYKSKNRKIIDQIEKQFLLIFMSHSKRITFHAWDCKMLVELYASSGALIARHHSNGHKTGGTHAYDALFKNTIILSNWWWNVMVTGCLLVHRTIIA